MASPKSVKPATAETVNGPHQDRLGGAINSQTDSAGGAQTQRKSKWRERYRVHPVADLFPMMSDEELDAQAADIKKNGLRYPITLLPGGSTVLDGRNRLEASERAGVELKPENFTTHTGDAPAFILSCNISRRHMSKGQRAMAVALIYPEPKRGQHSQLNNSTGLGFDKALLSQARYVLKHMPGLKKEVLDGSMSLQHAYDSVRPQKSVESKPSRPKAEPTPEELAAKVEEIRVKDKARYDKAQARREAKRAEIAQEKAEAFRKIDEAMSILAQLSDADAIRLIDLLGEMDIHLSVEAAFEEKREALLIARWEAEAAEDAELEALVPTDDLETEASGPPIAAEGKTLANVVNQIASEIESEAGTRRKKCKTCGGTKRVRGKAGIEFDCHDCEGVQL